MLLAANAHDGRDRCRVAGLLPLRKNMYIIYELKTSSAIMYNIKGRKVKQARSYSNVSKRCNLCLCEKYFIICKPEMSTPNNRSELISTCRHSRKFLLKTVFA